MQIRLLLFGILVHSLLLLWSYDMYGKADHVKVSCPLLNKSEKISRRLILIIVRNPSQRGVIKGIGNQFFSNIPNIVYYGESIVPEFYNSSQNWIKTTYPSSWNDIREDSLHIFSRFIENIHEVNGNQTMFLFVLRNDINEQNLLYIKHEMENIKVILDKYYGDNKTTCLIFCEENHSLWSAGFDIIALEEIQERYADLVPLVSTLLAVNIPYQSVALLPLNYLSSTRDKAFGLYCNALNLRVISEKAKQRIGLLKFVTRTRITSALFTSTSATVERLLNDKNFTGALFLAKNLVNISMSSFITSKQIVNIFTLIFVIIALVGWIVLLSSEYIELVFCKYISLGRRYVIHLPFIFLSLVMICIPFLQNWPYSYHFYFQIPVLILWLVSLRVKSFSCIEWREPRLKKLLLFLFILLLAEEYVLCEEELILRLSICAMALLPSLPRFRQVPFIFIIGWFTMSALLLGGTFLMKHLEPSTKYVNFSGTIWLMLAGISILWISPRKDTILTCVLTACLGAAMWLQNACFTTNKMCYIVMYCTWPLFGAIIIPIIGKCKLLNKVIQCIFAFGVPVMFSSTTLEPMSLLLILGYTASWAAVESYYSISNWDNLRRMSVIIYLFILTEKLTATDYISFKCLICNIGIHNEMYLFILKHIRILITYSSVLIVYRLIIGSQMHGYSSAILASLVLSFASLRVLFPLAVFSLNSDNLSNLLYQHVRINTMAIILILSYSAAMIYARNNKHLATPSRQTFELSEL